MEESRRNFVEKLTVKKMEIEESLVRLRQNQKDYNDQIFDESIADESDNAQREMSVCSNYSLIERKTRELKRVSRLIEQVLRDENFGICEECGERIPTERLLIVPEACLCVPCQRETEKFDHLRSVTVKPSALQGRREQDWEEYSETEEDDYVFIDPDFDIYPLEIEEPKRPEPNEST
jgi:DnaK suppressor protein